MKKSVKFIGVGLLILAVLSVVGWLGNFVKLSAQDQPEAKKSDAPVLDYESEIHKILSAEQKGKSSRFNGKGNYDGKKRIAELPQGFEILPTMVHWWVVLSALPVGQSDVVVVGEVVEAEARLSDDKTGIYSEFTVRTEELLKGISSSLGVGNILTANRIGGAVKFASGKFQEYRINRQGMPQRGGRYILFLKREDGGDFTILTGYRLSNGSVTPLDGEDTDDPAAELPFARYKK